VPTPDDLLTRAEALEREAGEAMDRGEMGKAARLLSQAIALLRAAGDLKDRPKIGMMGHTMQAQAADSREVKISKAKSGRRGPEVQALHAAGLTPQKAAELCGTTRDVLKQAWAKGAQFRRIRAEWSETLEKHGVPKSVWRSK
jgi:hypothetical protein